MNYSHPFEDVDYTAVARAMRDAQDSACYGDFEEAVILALFQATVNLATIDYARHAMQAGDEGANSCRMKINYARRVVLAA